MKTLSIAAFLTVAATGCTDTMPDGSDDSMASPEAEPSDVTVTTDEAMYMPGSAVDVVFEGLSGDRRDEIGIERVRDRQIVAVETTGGTELGDVLFRGLQPDTYVAHAFPMGKSVSAGTSRPFTIIENTEVVAASKTSYRASENVIVSFAGFTPDDSNWITITKDAADLSVLSDRHFTQGRTSGTMSFGSRLPGNYDVRAFIAGTMMEVAHSQFRVMAPTFALDQSAPSGGTLSVRYAGMPGNTHDWVAIAPMGSDDHTYTAWTYTGGGSDGEATFNALPAGSYVIRAFLDDGFDKLAESEEFTVE